MAVTGWLGPRWAVGEGSLTDLGRIVADLLVAQATLEATVTAQAATIVDLTERVEALEP